MGGGSDCNRRGYSRIPPLIGLDLLKEFFLCVLDAVRENSLLDFLSLIFLGLLIISPYYLFFFTERAPLRDDSVELYQVDNSSAASDSSDLPAERDVVSSPA